MPLPTRNHSCTPRADARSRHKPDFGEFPNDRVAQDIARDIAKDIVKIAPAARPKSACDKKEAEKYGASMAAKSADVGNIVP
jgi:hypothetical protein